MKFLNEQAVSILVTFFVGIAIGSLGLWIIVAPKNTEDGYAVRSGGYTFINPLLSCNISENKEFTVYAPLKDKLVEFIDASIAKNDAQKISVYFRGLNSAHWAGVDENEQYSPASLLKVQLLIAYLKFAETQPGLLDKTIVYERQSADANATEEIRPTKTIRSGGTYSIADLLKYMIAYSDNNAMVYLQEHIDQTALMEVYSDLGITPPKNLTDETVSPKDYSYILRILYNGTYLSKEMSQYALELMSTVDFKLGLRAGLPSGIIVSQKFGERTVTEKDSPKSPERVLYKELHDCGIVYYPKNPYLLCVMTKGNDFKKLEAAIGAVSNLVYKETNAGILKL